VYARGLLQEADNVPVSYRRSPARAGQEGEILERDAGSKGSSPDIVIVMFYLGSIITFEHTLFCLSQS